MSNRTNYTKDRGELLALAIAIMVQNRAGGNDNPFLSDAEAAVNDAGIMMGRADEMGFRPATEATDSPDGADAFAFGARARRQSGGDGVPGDCDCPSCRFRRILNTMRDDGGPAGVDPAKDGDDITTYALYLTRPTSDEMAGALSDIVDERCEQVFVHGRSPQEDDTKNTGRDLARGAIAFLFDGIGFPEMANNNWPFPVTEDRFAHRDAEDYTKPGSNYQRSLVKAAAMIVAELERLKRIHKAMPEAEFIPPVTDAQMAAGAAVASAVAEDFVVAAGEGDDFNVIHPTVGGAIAGSSTPPTTLQD